MEITAEKAKLDKCFISSITSLSGDLADFNSFLFPTHDISYFSLFDVAQCGTPTKG